MSQRRFRLPPLSASVAGQVLALLTIAYVLSPLPRSGTTGYALAGVLFLAQTSIASFAALSATRGTRGTRRMLFAAIGTGTALAALAALAWLASVALTGSPPAAPIIAAGAGAVAQVVLGVALASAIGRQRQWLRADALLDALLLVAAAVIVVMLIGRVTEPATPPAGWTHVAAHLWEMLATADLVLVALLLAWRGELLGNRVAAGVALGTVAAALGSFLFSRSVLMDGGDIGPPIIILWSLATACWLGALQLPPSVRAAASGEVPVAKLRTPKVRIVSIVIAVIIASISALILGVSQQRELTLGLSVAAFGMLLAARAGYALWLQQRTATALADTVEAEREVSVTLEQRVGARTRELADAQRVLQRMWTLAQQIAVELNADRVLARFLEAAVDVVQGDAGVVALMQDQRVVIAASSGLPDELRGQMIPLDTSAIGGVVRSGDVWWTEDVRLHARPESLSEAGWSIRDQPVRGMAVIPLQRRGTRIGAVAICTRARRWFTDEEIARVEAMTDLLSVALANAELVETLRRTEWRFRTLFRAAPDAVLTVLESGRVREANEAVRDILGVPPIQVIGRSIEEFVVPDDRDRLRYEIAQALTGAPSRTELRFEHQRGTRVVSLAARLLPEADPPTVLFVGRDITGEREMRVRLAETERLAAVGELVAGVAHEVNNPLSTISAFAQLLLRDGHLGEDQRESIEVIRGETVRASQVLRDLLTFARRSESQRQLLDVSDVVERTLRLRGYEMSSGGITLDADLATALPAVSGDARQIQQVVLNLVTNALQAMSPGGGTLRVATWREDGRIKLEVRDTGGGIPADVRERIFEPFFTTKSDGTGLGLSVSYGIVTAHGGTIEVVESSSCGTAFHVSLPVCDTTGGEVPGVGPASFLDRSPLKGIRLLFVDDESTLRSGMKAFGRLRRFTVETAGDGEEALALVRAQPFDVMVCDLRMPRMDGPTLFAHLQREVPEIAARTMFVTGDTVGSASREFLERAGQPVLSKPFEFERLEELLIGLVGGAKVPAAPL